MRRAAHEGSIYRRKSDGRWVGVIHLGYDGERRKRRVVYGRTEREVLDKLKAAERRHDDGLPPLDEKTTFGAYLERWLAGIQPSLRPNTWRRYSQYVRVHTTPRLGRLPLARLTPAHLQELYAERLAAGLSPTTVRHLHATLYKALGQAARWGFVARSVAALVDPPRATRREMQTLARDEVNALIDAAQSERLGAAIVLAVTSGMRRGEVLGLHWRDCDLERGVVNVRVSLQWTKAGALFAEPKTAKSRRQVTLTRVALDALRQHRRAQTEERLRLGAAWQDYDLVFASEVGGPIEPNNFVRRTYARTLRAAGLPALRFHDLRHTAATLLLGEGLHPKIVSEMLGHSQIAMTMDLYSHVTPTMMRQAADAMDLLLVGNRQ